MFVVVCFVVVVFLGGEGRGVSVEFLIVEVIVNLLYPNPVLEKLPKQVSEWNRLTITFNEYYFLTGDACKMQQRLLRSRLAGSI